MKVNSFKLDVALANVPMSYAELAKECGVTPTTLARLKKGTQEPRPATVGKIARALGVKVIDIIEEMGDVAHG